MAPSTAVPMPSRTVRGGRHGSTRKGPGPTPHIASVWANAHQEWAGAHAPDAPRLAEVARRLLRPELLLGDVEEAADPERAVDQEPAQLGSGALGPPLQQVVAYPGHDEQIVEAAVDHLLEPVRHHEVVGFRNRLQHVLVHVVVEREHLLVERLPRVVLLEHALRRGGW